MNINHYQTDLNKYLVFDPSIMDRLAEWYGWTGLGFTKKYWGTTGHPPKDCDFYRNLSKSKKTEANKYGLIIPNYQGDHWSLLDIERAFEDRDMLAEYVKNINIVAAEEKVECLALMPISLKCAAALLTIGWDYREEYKKNLTYPSIFDGLGTDDEDEIPNENN